MLDQDKKNKVAQELAAHQQQMQGGGLGLSQGTRRILQERQRHTIKAGQAAAAMTASGLLNQVTHHIPAAALTVFSISQQGRPSCRRVPLLDP